MSKKIRQQDLPNNERDSRTFSIRLSNNPTDPEQANARLVCDIVWDEWDKTKRKLWVIKVFGDAGIEDNITQTEYMSDLAILSENMVTVQDGQKILIDQLQQQIEMLERERKMIRGFVEQMGNTDFEFTKTQMNEYVDSGDVDPELKDSLLDLISGESYD